MHYLVLPTSGDLCGKANVVDLTTPSCMYMA
jgi:hypothetical protein